MYNFYWKLFRIFEIVLIKWIFENLNIIYCSYGIVKKGRYIVLFLSGRGGGGGENDKFW